MTKLGQNVIYRQGVEDNLFNGHHDHPAVVTCVHSDEMVNLKVFFDCGNCEDRTSVLHRPVAIKNQQDHYPTWDFD